MKKIIVAILALLYIGTSTGASIHVHYCMGQLDSWGIGHDDSKTCGKCGMDKFDEEDNGCCKDEHKFFKDDTAQKITESNLQLLQILSLAIQPAFIQLPTKLISSITETNPTSHAPPRTNGVEVYIRNCTFLI